MYHRIADPITDPWELAVSPENFEEHLKVLRAYNVISTDELENIFNKKSFMGSRSVVITFDDGYRDNYKVGKPLLEKYNFPATFFIPTDSIGTKEEFWWDALERICFQPIKLPDQLILEHPYNIALNFLEFYDNSVLRSRDLYLQLCDIVRKMPAKYQANVIKKLEKITNNDCARPEYLTMDKEELMDLQAANLFSIGAHTMTHPFLPDFPYNYQKAEILGGITFLENLIGKPVNSLAYPHGGRNQDTLKIVTDSTVKLAFTTDPQLFNMDTNIYSIPRFQVKNWDGETFEYYLNNWLEQHRPLFWKYFL